MITIGKVGTGFSKSVHFLKVLAYLFKTANVYIYFNFMANREK